MTDSIRPQLIGGLMGAGLAATFCVISTLAQLMPPRGQLPAPLKTVPLTALYAYLTYRNARECGRTFRLINQPAAQAGESYYRLARVHWTMAQTGATYTVRALLPEMQLAHGLVDLAGTAALAAGAYHCRHKALSARVA